MHIPVPRSPVHPVLIQTVELRAEELWDEAGCDMWPPHREEPSGLECVLYKVWNS